MYAGLHLSWELLFKKKTFYREWKAVHIIGDYIYNPYIQQWTWIQMQKELLQ